MSQCDIITFGSVTLDTILRLKQGESIELEPETPSLNIPLGDKVPVEDLFMTCGGGAANSAVGFSKLGLSTVAVGVIGDDVNQEFIVKTLQNAGVNTDYLVIESGGKCSLSVVLSDWTGKRTVLHKRLKSENFNVSTIESLPDSKGFYIGHLQESASEILHALAHKYTDEERLIGWNPGKTQFKQGFETYLDVFPLVDVLILNAEEARDFTGIDFAVQNFQEADPSIYGQEVCGYDRSTPDTIADVRSQAKKFLEAGVEIVCITDGSRGAQIFDGTNHFWAPPLEAVRKDSLGAGDAFSIGVVGARLRGLSLDKQIMWGSLNAGAVIQDYGAQAGQLFLKDLPQ